MRTRPKRNEKLYDLPNGGAIDGFPIMVAINDEYQGIYTLNIPKDKWMFGMTDGAKECILTAETHAKGTQFAEEAKVDKTDFEMEYVPDESNTQWVKDSVNTLIRAVMNFSGTTAADVESALSPYLDLDSAVDYFIITSMFALTDNLDKNYILMTFDGVKWAFSEYDLDTAFGNCWNGKVFLFPTNELNEKPESRMVAVETGLEKAKADLIAAATGEQNTLLSAAVVEGEAVEFTYTANRCINEKAGEVVPLSSENTAFRVSDPIPVAPGELYAFTVSGGWSKYLYAFYDADDKVVGGFQQKTDMIRTYNDRISPVPATAATVRIAWVEYRELASQADFDKF